MYRIHAIQGTALDPHLICECEGVYVHPAVCEQPKAVCAQLEVSAGDVDKREVRGALSVWGHLGLQVGEGYSGRYGIQICVFSKGEGACVETGNVSCFPSQQKTPSAIYRPHADVVVREFWLLCARQQTLTREEGK